MIRYQSESDLSVDEYISLLVRSTLSERRPIEDREFMTRMVENADLIVTAREGGKLVGLARAITDWTYCTYLADLAVDSDYQKQGIGTELLKQTYQQTGDQTKLLLLSAPKAVGYYERIGLEKHPACFLYNEQTELQ